MPADLLSKLQQLGAENGALARFKALIEPVQARNPGVRVVGQDEAATYLHLLLEGWACRSRVLTQGARATLAIVLGGEFCDLEALTLGRRTTDVSILSAARIARIQLDPLRRLLAAEPTLSMAFQRLSALERLVADEWLVGLGRRSAMERIAHLICELVIRKQGAPERDSATLEWPLRQAELADATGLSVVHVNRSLQTLRQDAVVATEKRLLAIADWRRLVEIAGFDAAYLGPWAVIAGAARNRNLGLKGVG